MTWSICEICGGDVYWDGQTWQCMECGDTGEYDNYDEEIYGYDYPPIQDDNILSGSS